MPDLRVIGDEIHFEGQLVAILTTSGTASCRGDFVDLLEDWQPPPPESDEPLPYAQALDDLLSHAEPHMKHGLLRRADLVRIIAQLQGDDK